MKPYCVTIQMKAIEQFVHVVLFIMLYIVVLTFKSVAQTPVCDHSNENYWAVISLGVVFYVAQSGCNFSFWRWNPSVTIYELINEDYSAVDLSLFKTKSKISFITWESSEVKG